MLIYMFTLLLGCTEDPKTEQPDTDDTGSPLDSAQDTTLDDTNDTDDTDVVEVDPIEEGRTATTICSQDMSKALLSVVLIVLVPLTSVKVFKQHPHPFNGNLALSIPFLLNL